MRDLIRHILKEESLNNRILNVIDEEGIFAASDMVGGLDNLKKILKNEPEIVETINSFNGITYLVVHLNSFYYTFPMEFDIISKGVNKWNTRTWPIVNLKYDISESDREKFESFVNNAIGDLDFTDTNINPKVQKMFTERDYFVVGKINGKNYKYVEDSPKYDEDDIKRWVKKYGRSFNLNENEEDPTKDILNFLLRRYEVEEENYGDDENPRIIKRVCFKLAKREVVCISQFMDKKSQIRSILYELMRLGVIKPFENDGTQNNPYAQKAVRAVKMFLNQVIG